MTNGRKTALAAAGAFGLAWTFSRLFGGRSLDELEGRTVVITGATRGLGLCFARELAERNCRLVLLARDSAELDRAANELVSVAPAVLPRVCDVSDAQSVEQAMNEVYLAWGEPDVLINNAGVIVVGPVESMTLAQYRQCMDTMFWGTIYPTVELLPHMLRRGEGWILNVSSIGGRISVPHLLPYSCAKAAAAAFSEGLRAEVRSKGIKVLTAIPGLMRTGSQDNAQFRGDASAEHGWFAAMAGAPGITVDGQRAARQMLDALVADQAELHVGLAADLAARAHGLAPNLVADVLARVSTLLPAGSGDGATHEGRSLPEASTPLGRTAEAEYQVHRS